MADAVTFVNLQSYMTETSLTKYKFLCD